jgi:predicted MFS family arabinose efflux permease
MGYWGELRHNWRALLAASLGSGSGLMLMAYASTIFSPYLLKEFGWTRAEFALIGLSALSSLIALPFIGRATDRFGVRKAALVGALGIPACLVGYSLMTGSFAVYFLISTFILALGTFTSPIVYTRIIAADFREARGLALTVVTVTPALFGAIAAPLLTEIVETWGWRTGYRALAGFILVSSLVAIALVPKHDPAALELRPAKQAPARADFRLILTSGPFWVIFGAMFLCTLSSPLHASQMAVMLRENHLGAAQVAAMISIYGVGTICGRFACGIALDKLPTVPVAVISMILPAFGFALLASSLDTVAAIGFAMFTVGLAVGAEGDLQSFLVARHFDLRIFSTTLSLVYVAVYAASASGSALVSLTLKLTDSFSPFLAGTAVAVVIGSLLFALLPREPRVKIGGTE